MATSVSLSVPYTVFPLSFSPPRVDGGAHDPAGDGRRSCYTSPIVDFSSTRKRRPRAGSKCSSTSSSTEIATAVDGEGVNIYNVQHPTRHLLLLSCLADSWFWFSSFSFGRHKPSRCILYRPRLGLLARPPLAYLALLEDDAPTPPCPPPPSSLSVGRRRMRRRRRRGRTTTLEAAAEKESDEADMIVAY